MNLGENIITQRNPQILTLATKNIPKGILVQHMFYANGANALKGVDANTSEPYCTFSVNLPDMPAMGDYIWIKDYSENEGVYYALIASGIIEYHSQRCKGNHAIFKMGKLL